MSHIVAQTLRFHRQTTRPVPTHFREVLESVLALHRGRTAGRGIVVERRYRNARPMLGDTGAVRQVVANLVGNALDAMPGGGRLLLRKREATGWRTGRRGVRVTVADTGVGMSRETRARLFEPFFTTKSETGSGLGLWVSKDLVQKHGGAIRVRSREGCGTVFALFLPYDTPSGDTPPT